MSCTLQKGTLVTVFLLLLDTEKKLFWDEVNIGNNKWNYKKSQPDQSCLNSSTLMLSGIKEKTFFYRLLEPAFSIL